MNFVMPLAGLFVFAFAHQYQSQHASALSVAGGAPAKLLGGCSDEDQRFELMKFALNITPLPRGWGTVPVCGGSWEGVLCTDGCVTYIDGISCYAGTLDLSALPSGLQYLNLAHGNCSGTPNLSAL
eukprot:Hpha_TRINITY_DN25193_c0_g1::TRINITY_DN25193_c0_g1_i1::g.139347::m.139347